MNLGIFTGNLTKPAEVKQLQSGTSLCVFTIAVNSGYAEKEHTDFVDCAIFGKRAESKLPGFLIKGTKVLVSGDLQLAVREYNDKTYANMKLTVDKLDLIGGKAEAPQQQAAPATGNVTPDPYAEDASVLPF